MAARPPQKSPRRKPLTRLPAEGELDDLPASALPRAARASAAAHPDRRRWIYGGLDLAFAALHAVAITVAAPTRHALGQLVLWAVVAAFVAAAVGTLAGRPRGYWLAASACAALLVLEVVLLLLIVTSAAYLSGVFGAFGRGAAAISLAVGFLSLQLIALLPAFQLKYLRTRAGRRAFALPPRSA